MGNYVYSKITNDTVYADYVANAAGGLPSISKQVLIKGGANRADKHFVTPLGKMTEVSDDDLAFLVENDAFKRHTERGFIAVRHSEANADRVAADLTDRDKSAPLRPSDYLDGQGHPGVTKPPSAQSEDAIVQETKGIFARLAGK